MTNTRTYPRPRRLWPFVAAFLLLALFVWWMVNLLGHPRDGALPVPAAGEVPVAERT
jgi:hypothetical protein